MDESNRFSQKGQGYRFFTRGELCSECRRLCSLKRFLSKNSFRQCHCRKEFCHCRSGHIYGLGSRWVASWVRRVEAKTQAILDTPGEGIRIFSYGRMDTPHVGGERIYSNLLATQGTLYFRVVAMNYNFMVVKSTPWSVPFSTILFRAVVDFCTSHF